MTLYPLALKLGGRRVLVVGGGTVATRRVPALLDAGAEVVLVSPSLTPALRALAGAGRLTWLPRRFADPDLDGVWLVQVAVDDPDAAAAVSAACASRRVFCVRADDRHAASAWTPAVTRYGEVTVAVLGGGDPRRAMALRDAIAAELAAGRLAPDRLRADAGGTGGGTGGGEGDRGADGAGAGSGAGSGSGGESSGGSVALVGAGPGDPELITVKGRRLLAAADVVVADRLAPGLLLDELRGDVELIDASKIPYGPARAQDEINRILVDRARAGATVVRLKGGDPYVFGRGGEEVLACAAAGVPVTVVPGVTSAVAVPAAAGIPVTHRGLAHEFVVVSGHLAPDDPASRVSWSALARLRGTLVIMMGMRNLPAITEALLAHGRPPATPAALVAEGTTATQRTVVTTLAELPGRAAGVRPPAVVVVGAVVPLAVTGEPGGAGAVSAGRPAGLPR